MSSTSTFELFNNKLSEFIEDLRGVLGTLPEYKMIASSSRLLSQVQVRQNCNLFYQYVVIPYGEQIMARDEKFLLDHDFTKEASEAGSGAGVVDLLKKVWTSMSLDDRESVWGHLGILIVLSRRCLSK